MELPLSLAKVHLYYTGDSLRCRRYFCCPILDIVKQLVEIMNGCLGSDWFMMQDWVFEIEF